MMRALNETMDKHAGSIRALFGVMNRAMEHEREERKYMSETREFYRKLRFPVLD